jgi:hypothetical protein
MPTDRQTDRLSLGGTVTLKALSGVTNGTGVQEESLPDCCTLKKGALLSYETSVTFYCCAVSGINIVN